MSVPRDFQIWVHGESSHAVKTAIVLWLLRFCREAYVWSVACHRGSQERTLASSLWLLRQWRQATPHSTSFSLVTWVVTAELLLTCHRVSPLM